MQLWSVFLSKPCPSSLTLWVTDWNTVDRNRVWQNSGLWYAKAPVGSVTVRLKSTDRGWAKQRTIPKPSATDKSSVLVQPFPRQGFRSNTGIQVLTLYWVSHQLTCIISHDLTPRAVQTHNIEQYRSILGVQLAHLCYICKLTCYLVGNIEFFTIYSSNWTSLLIQAHGVNI